VVPRILRRHACGDRLRALEPRARVERDALQAAVEIDAASRALRVERHGRTEPVAAARAAADLVRRHEIPRLRPFRTLAPTAPLLGLRRGSIAIPGLVL